MSWPASAARAASTRAPSRATWACARCLCTATRACCPRWALRSLTSSPRSRRAAADALRRPGAAVFFIPGVREATRPGLCVRSRRQRSWDRRAWQGSPRPSNGSSARLCSASASRQAPRACWLQALQAEACMRAWVAPVSERLRGVPGLHSRPDPCGALPEPALCGDGRRGHDGLPARERRGCCVRDGVQVRTTVLLTRHVRWMLLALSTGLPMQARVWLCARGARHLLRRRARARHGRRR